MANNKAKSRKSKIELLPPEIKQWINAVIRSGEMQQTELLDALNAKIKEAGLPDDATVSYTSMNRYHRRMENIGSRVRQAREVAEVWTTKLGDAPVSDVGKLLQEFVRTMAFETSMHLMDEAEKTEKPIPPKALGQLALVIQRIEQAAMVSQKVEKEIRKAFAEEAATQTEKIVKQAGITAATAADIKRQILGIA
ncbi:hypothetical protein C9J12_08270 [Photobacterium frigidiphilum]|uniref:DUF3486 domain-containing protein n=1 Tax=Photobacterium frigidiphilum TaxID=264736 RepID=A0A2T3JCP2_9GAMM|nr:DUF3486 family protein [Photobacterium frigidiphilum]PSU46656.1 hypothetical protein C9J12_18285 [Photobacterium frigidiphilum]PSU49474.1 hypothetical protein C9J12_08270 [Photobacterium frigidiphilum]